MGEHQRSGPTASKPSRAGLKWAAVTVVGGFVLASVALYVGWSNAGDWTKRKLVDTAKQQGVILELNDIDVSLNKLHLREARARLEGVDGVTGYLQSVDIGLSRFKPNRIQMDGVIVQVVGQPLRLVGAVRAWQSRHPAKAAVDAPPKPEIRHAKITWQEATNSPPFLELDGVKVSNIAKPYAPIGNDLAIVAEHAEVGAFNLSPLSAALHIEAESIEIGLGATEWDAVSARGGWKNQLYGDELHLSFGPLEIGPLLVASGLNIGDKSLATASIYGGLSVLVPSDAQRPYQGRFAIDAKGYTPPHPPELQGFPFGDTTRLESSFEIDRALTSAVFSDMHLTSGEFKLKGNAAVRGSSLSMAHVEVELKGHVPCTALAAAVAGSKLGRVYGNWVGQHASQMVEGNVDVTVQVKADAGALGQAKVAKQIGVGCGLRPMTARDMLDLGLPPIPDADFIRHIGKDLPNWGTQLPPLPSMKLPDWHPPDWMKPGTH
jgi:hypothetical protein